MKCVPLGIAYGKVREQTVCMLFPAILRICRTNQNNRIADKIAVSQADAEPNAAIIT